MNQIKNKKGFTIVETLIVLAVTGVFFMSTATLIQGQVERNRYQDSMRQLQALFQTTINDVEDGYMKNDGGDDGSKLLVGKRFWFCRDSGAWDFCSANSGSTMVTETIVQDNTPAGKLTHIDQSTQGLPGGLKFLYFRSLMNDGVTPAAGHFQEEFGSSIILTDANGNKGKDITALASARLYDRSGDNLLSKSGYILCFEGLHKGSIELGGANIGNTVIMKPVDDRCEKPS